MTHRPNPSPLALPESLEHDAALVRKALHGPVAGREVLEVREAHERLVTALRGARGRAEAWQAKVTKQEGLRAAVLALGAELRRFNGNYDFTSNQQRDVDDLLNAMCDAEERATRG